MGDHYISSMCVIEGKQIRQFPADLNEVDLNQILEHFY